MTGPAKRWEAVMLPNYGTPNLLLTEGEGCFVTDSEGNQYLDLLAGLAVNILGHAHPTVVAAVRDQVARLGHTSNLYANEPALSLAERLSALAGGRRVAQLNSGTEANELAYKVVRKHAHAEGMDDAVVVAFERSFHGRTLGALALTGQPAYHEGFGPFPPGIVHVPFNDPGALEAAFERHTVAGVFAEYVQGEGGVTPMTGELADALGRLCRTHGAALVADEVQTGVCRTGRFFAHEHFGAEPDLITLAKGLGGGLPVGACLLGERYAALMGPGTHGCTFGGNAVASAAALAVLDVVEEQDLAGRAAALGKRVHEQFAEAGHPARGLGLLLGVPLAKPVAGEVTKAALAEGLLIGQAGKAVTRLAPPLVIDAGALEGAVPRVAGSIEAALAS